MANEYNKRINRAMSALRIASKIDAILVSSASDLLYLTGFKCEGARMLLFSEDEPVFFIDTMNSAWCRESLKDFNRLSVKEGIVTKLICDELNRRGIKRLGITASCVSASEYTFIKKKIKKTRIMPQVSIVSDLRRVKSDIEIAEMRKASRKTVKIWTQIRKNICTGMTELDIARMADTLIREASSGISFETIASVGENTAFPHAIPTRRKLRDREHVLVDMGIIYNNYCSDLTRTYYNGRINRQIREFKNIIIKSSDLAIKMIKPGVSISRVAKAVNDELIGAGFGKYIRHGLGHGVGLDVHERPFVGVTSLERFKKGNVITVEPGLYLSGFGGVREENMVLVTAKGCEVLTV